MAHYSRRNGVVSVGKPNFKVSANTPKDTIKSISGPTTISKGENVTLTVDYVASTDRTIAVYMQSLKPKKMQFYKRITVHAGDELLEVSFTVPNDIPTSGTFRYKAYIAPKGGKWSDRLGEASQEGITVGTNAPLTREELMKLIENWKKDPSQANKLMIENANVSEITDMSDMFYGVRGDFDLSRWDVSNVTYMGGMFAGYCADSTGCDSIDPGDIGNWDVSSVTDMSAMFSHSRFNKPIGNWDVSHVTHMGAMFYAASYNHPLASWDVSSVTEMSAMFAVRQYSLGLGFDQDISNWDVSQVTNHNNFAEEGIGIHETLRDAYNPFSITTALNRWYNFTPDVYYANDIFALRATPLGNNINTVIGYSNGEANKYQDLGIIVRFAPNGKIDVRNGNSYEADTSVSYEANTVYRIRFDVNFDKKTYSVWLLDEFENPRVLIAKDYSFRTEQSSLNSVNNIAIFSRRNAGVIFGETAIE